ncbi:MAG: aminopeptidase P family protein [Candidatus Bathyarchaeota archaeon]|nr:MAG: aminopeptidase P family protein [Candidatus Bathyarchaeota archaeon]
MNLWNERLSNARKLMNKNGIDVLVLNSAENLQYLSGVTDPTLHACGTIVLPFDGTPVLIVLWRDIEVARRQSHIQNITVAKGVADAKQHKVAQVLSEVITPGATVGVDSLDFSEFEALKTTFQKTTPNAKFVDASDTLSMLRFIKSADEIKLIRKAAEISDRGMEAAVNALRIGATELEVAAEAEYEMKKRGSWELKHPTVVASGPRTLLVHPFASEKRIEKNDLVIIDLGAVYGGYCSDICRTCIVGASKQTQEDLFKAVLEAQTAAFSALKEDITIGTVNKIVRKLLQRSNYEKYFPYLLGHFIGLQLEEEPMIMPKNGNIEFKSNTVASLFQSSVFVPEAGGVRIEDTALVTKTKSEILTNYRREFIKA